jgi:exonuclease SbcD
LNGGLRRAIMVSTTFMKIIHFADLHLGVETYGRIDPNTGLSSRLTDFLTSFDELVDYALAHSIDLVLFCGDAYKTREPTQTQQREFARRINRLALAGIPVFILTGNHDLPNTIGRATATEIFDTLAVKNVYIASKPDIYTIATRAGTLQIVALPWLRRSALLAREDIKNLNMEQLTAKMQEALTQVISTKGAALDPQLPSVLAAHVLVGDAKVGRGSESLMSLGREPAILLGNVALPCFDYVALGHIHKHQALNENPPVVYSGSLGRIDFGEEKDDKGFYVVELDVAKEAGKRLVSYEFHPVKTRRFLTIDITVKEEDTDPTSVILNAINLQREKVPDAVVRVNITVPSSLESQLRTNDVKDALKEAHNFTVSRDIVRETRLRIGSRAAEDITPIEGLKAYLETQNIPQERRKILLDYGEKLIAGQESGS